MAATAQDSQAPLRGPEKKDEDREEDTEYSPFYGIEKGAVLQEARIFHDSQIDARRCQQVITKLLYLLHQGETFTKKEASEVFFALTKLFQSKDTNLRRMMYLCIKDICPGADEVIIVTSSLMKDMNSKVELYRANAIRVLCQIIDSQLLAQMERYLKQAVVDKSPVVAAAVLLSAVHLVGDNPEVIKRWVGEVQEAVQSRHSMVQFHAVALLHALRAADRLAISKLVTQLTKSNVKSPLAQCLLVRYVAQVVQDTQPGANGEARPFYEYLESCLRHKAEMVIFEAARAICNLRDVTSRELSPAITVLQLFLSSSKPVLRFAAVRTLSRVAMNHPLAVAACNIDLEALIADPNRSIATLAITTLLKTGSESSVDKLLKQIATFMADIADDFKIVVVEAVRALCAKYPAKYRALMAFLSNVLREEGGLEYKKAIVAAILGLVQALPEAKELGLTHLCEFIEDCEFTFLSTQILHLLGQEGPSTRDPARYIRYIYNRIVLENATVRAAAVTALAEFGRRVEALRPRITALLRRALYDADDEVRDRATLYLTQLRGLAGGHEAVEVQLDANLLALERALKDYAAGPTDRPFDLAAVPKAAPKVTRPDPKSGMVPSATSVASPAATPAFATTAQALQYETQLKAVPQLAGLGALFKSSAPVRLTEEDTEYVVTAVKHVFDDALVLQFNCTNTITEQLLENVSVLVDLADAPDFEAETVVPLDVMPGSGEGQCYVVLRPAEGALAVGKLLNVLKFTVKEIDPATGDPEDSGYEDEYQLEELDVTYADYVKPAAVGNFRAAWEELAGGAEQADDYGLGAKGSLQEAVEAVLVILGMQVAEGTDAVPPNARSHTVLLAGVLLGEARVLVRAAFGIDSSGQVAMKLVARAEEEATCEAIHAIITDS